MAEKTKKEELEYLTEMLTATKIEDTDRLRSIAKKIKELTPSELVLAREKTDEMLELSKPVMKFIKAFANYRCHYQIQQPTSCKKIQGNWLDFFKLFLIILCRMSVFNPYTFGWITKNILHSKKIFTSIH